MLIGVLWVPKWHSNPIADRVRRKRQRLPSSRCIKSDRRTFSRLRNSSSAVASDTTLGLPITNPWSLVSITSVWPTILELVLAVLDAQRELNANEDLLAQSRTTQTVNLIALYKALGGGWQSVTLQ